MRKCILIMALLAVTLAGPAAGAGNGAVNVPFDPAVGWVNLNTTADGRLIVVAHLDGGLPDAAFSVSVRVRYEDQTTDVMPDIGTFTTNGQGEGNFQVAVDIAPPAGSGTLRRVAVRVRQAPVAPYVAVAWDIPLKRGASARPRLDGAAGSCGR